MFCFFLLQCLNEISSHNYQLFYYGKKVYRSQYFRQLYSCCRPQSFSPQQRLGSCRTFAFLRKIFKKMYNFPNNRDTDITTEMRRFCKLAFCATCSNNTTFPPLGLRGVFLNSFLTPPSS